MRRRTLQRIRPIPMLAAVFTLAVAVVLACDDPEFTGVPESILEPVVGDDPEGSSPGPVTTQFPVLLGAGERLLPGDPPMEGPAMDAGAGASAPGQPLSPSLGTGSRPAIAANGATGGFDLLWRNTATGINGLWEMNGPSPQAWHGIQSLNGSAWRMQGAGDLTGDGSPDVVWRNMNSGTVGVWEMDGLTLSGWDGIGVVLSPTWHLVGVADVTGDGQVDLVWHSGLSGTVGAWELDGADVAAWWGIGRVANTDWAVQGVGDFTGDGKADLVWRNTVTGANTVLELDGVNPVLWHGLNALGNTDWWVTGVGDLTGDGKTDLVWRNASTGTLLAWELDGTAYVDWHPLGVIGSLNWELGGIAEMVGDVGIVLGQEPDQRLYVATDFSLPASSHGIASLDPSSPLNGWIERDNADLGAGTISVGSSHTCGGDPQYTAADCSALRGGGR